MTEVNDDPKGISTTNFTINISKLGSVGRFSFLPTIIMPLYTGKDGHYRVLTLLDSGAGHSWVAGKILKYVNHTFMPSQKLTIGTLNGSVSRKCKLVQIYFRTETLVPIECFVLDDFVEHIMVKGMKEYLRSNTTFEVEEIEKVIEPSDNTIDHANLSLGTAVVLSNAAIGLICPRKSLRTNLVEHRLVLEQTIFGTALSGEIPESLRENYKVVQAMCVTPKVRDDLESMAEETADAHEELGYQREVLEDEIKFLWEKHNLGIFIHEVHDDDLMAIQRVEESLKHLESGQFEVRLPFNGKIGMLESNRRLAYMRTKRQLQEMAMKEKYRTLVVKAKIELEQSDYIERVTDGMEPGKVTHFLAWRGIMKEDSNTTKLRIVMDASAKMSVSTVSLNQCLYQGPNMILNLAKCLIRFMIGKYRCVADIEKAFLRILIAVEDRDVLRFFWPVDPSDPNSDFLIYRWKAVLFGSIASPFILATVLKKLITSKSPSIYTQEALLNGIYVDNLFHADSNEENLIKFFEESREVLDKGGFNLREWGSNSIQVRQKAMQFNVLVKDNKLGALGLWWSQEEDKFSFKKNFSWNKKHTKRSVLSFTNAVFDPLNWLCPLHIQNRSFLRDLWAKKYKWDQDFQNINELVHRWKYLREQCFAAVDLEMDINVVITNGTQVHVFADASTQAYGAVLYMVTPPCEECPEGQVKMIKAKGKIVPVDKKSNEDTMPRWELCAILIAANLLVFVVSAVKQLEDKEIVIWNDSKAALSWCSQESITDTFVHRRVADIRDRCPTATIKYVQSAENPADILTRDITAADLKKCSLWWQGPKWIIDKKKWPITEQVYNLHPAIRVPQHNHTAAEADPALKLQTLNMFKDHRFHKSLRSLAWLIRWRTNKSGNRRYFEETIGVKELEETKMTAVRVMQMESFGNLFDILKAKGRVNLEKYRKLGLYLDTEHNIIRCKSRVQFTILESPSEAPILVDPENEFVLSYIKYIHVSNNCAGSNFTLNAVRQEIYCFKLNATIKKVIGRCHICMRFRCHPYRYPMQPVLPLIRSTTEPPFTFTGVDFSGPHQVREAAGVKKVWICLFTCLVSRAIYLVLVEDMKSTTFLLALRELACRRIRPKVLISDNAATFTHTSKLLRHVAAEAKIKQEITSQGIEWKFIPAMASWFGGVYERMIGVMKKELMKMCGNGAFTLQEFKDCLHEVERVVNNRPLCKVGENEVITPAHILNGAGTDHGSELADTFAGDIIERVKKARKELPRIYNEVKERKLKFWKSFQDQYLETLRFTTDRMGNRYKREPKVGDICVIHSDDPRNKWKMAIIMQRVEGSDGSCRQCVIKTSNGVTTRSVLHLYPLELTAEDYLDEDNIEQQTERALKHTGELKELKQRVAKAARDSDMKSDDLEQVLDKLDLEEKYISEKVIEKPRRKAALKAMELRQQMIRDNVL